MNSNVFHRKVELPFKINHSHLKLPTQERSFFLDPYCVEDHRITDLIEECGAYIVHSECFSLPPRGFVTIHLDDGLLYNRTKLNMFIGTGLMSWFNPLPEHRDKQITLTEIGSPYMSFSIEEVELVHQNQMYGNYLINPGIPHNFVNNSAHECWVVSLNLFDKNTENYLLFEDALEKFSKYLKG